MPGGCSSLVVVEAKSPRFSSVGVTARSPRLDFLHIKV